MKATEELETLDDDGLITPEIGAWGEHKYRLMLTYAEMFVRAMKGKWDRLIYVDLFAGSGRARLRESGKVILASPLLAMSILDGFHKYIFCEKDEDKKSSFPQNLPLYRLALFSRSKLGAKFWTEARKYSKSQMELFE